MASQKSGDTAMTPEEQMESRARELLQSLRHISKWMFARDREQEALILVLAAFHQTERETEQRIWVEAAKLICLECRENRPLPKESRAEPGSPLDRHVWYENGWMRVAMCYATELNRRTRFLEPGGPDDQ